LPAKLLGNEDYGSFRSGPFIEQLYEGGFIPLGEEPNREIAFGLIGQFWKLAGDAGSPAPVSDSQAFLDFDDSEYAKCAANLAVGGNNGSVYCSTETRIHVPDPITRRKFAMYWRMISMGSGWIRVLWLQAIKRKAEAA
jgi:hypothetical protein